LLQGLLTALLFIALFVSPSVITAQTSESPPSSEPKSLAEIARSEKNTKKAKAKTVITDEGMEERQGPFPKLNLEGVDNSDEIAPAMGEFARKNKAEATETAVHSWYERYDRMIDSAIEENIKLRDLRESNVFNGQSTCQESPDYRHCELRRRVEVRSARQDAQTMNRNLMLTGRIQQAFMRIRTAITAYGLHYDWFKVRNGNGNGSF
jgi:hypothetical protein